jgi:hypothetical protein
MVEYIMKKENLRDISCKMRDAGFDVSFRDCPANGGTGGHPTDGPSPECSSSLDILINAVFEATIFSFRLYGGDLKTGRAAIRRSLN